MTPFGFSVIFTPTATGVAYGTLQRADDTNASFTNASATCDEVKSRAIAETTILHRFGSSPRQSCAFANVSVFGGVESRQNLARCHSHVQSDDTPEYTMLEAGASYHLFVCVESTDRESTVSLPLRISVPVSPSLMFVASPTIIGDTSEDGTVVQFRTTGAGVAWAVVVEDAAAPSDADEVKHPSTGSVHCNATTLVHDTSMNNITLSGCSLIHGQSYSVYVYIESDHYGSLSAAVPAVVEWFVSTPHVVDIITPFGFAVSFTSYRNGRVFGALERAGSTNSSHMNASNTCLEIQATCACRDDYAAPRDDLTTLFVCV